MVVCVTIDADGRKGALRLRVKSAPMMAAQPTEVGTRARRPFVCSVQRFEQQCYSTELLDLGSCYEMRDGKNRSSAGLLTRYSAYLAKLILIISTHMPGCRQLLRTCAIYRAKYGVRTEYLGAQSQTKIGPIRDHHLAICRVRYFSTTTSTTPYATSIQSAGPVDAKGLLQRGVTSNNRPNRPNRPLLSAGRQAEPPKHRTHRS